MSTLLPAWVTMMPYSPSFGRCLLRSLSLRSGALVALLCALVGGLAACGDDDKETACNPASLCYGDAQADQQTSDAEADDEAVDALDGAVADSATDASGEDTQTGADTASGSDTSSADTETDAQNSADTAGGLVATEAYEASARFGWIVAGQPSERRIAEVVAAGAVIISLRAPSEDPYNEEGLIASLGGTFLRYPTSAAQYDDVAFRTALYDLYDAQRTAGELVYLHCASGNRAAASWALYLAERLGVPGEEAIAEAKTVGLTSLESTVRLILGL